MSRVSVSPLALGDILHVRPKLFSSMNLGSTSANPDNDNPSHPPNGTNVNLRQRSYYKPPHSTSDVSYVFTAPGLRSRRSAWM